MMTIEKFAKRLDAYGSNLMRWLPGEAEEARTLLAKSEEARISLTQAQGLDRALNTYCPPVIDPDLVAQATHFAVHQPRPLPLPHRRHFSLPVFALGGAVAVAMVLLVLPMMGLQIAPIGPDLERVVKDLTRSEMMADNEVRSADEIFSMLETAPAEDQQDIEELLKTLDHQEPDAATDTEAPIWDTFMGQT